MLRQQSFAVLLFAIFTSISSLANESVTLEDGSTLTLKGIGVAQEYRTDIYIGALYAPTGYDSINLIRDASTPKRVAVRYIANNYSYRKVSRHWKERIAMNAEREVWGPHTRAIVEFARLFKQNIVTGDEIVIDYMPSVGTKVYLNGVFFHTIDDPMFIDLLINSWTGTVPPTKAFKEGILGNISDAAKQDILAQFSGLTPIQGRFKKEEEKTEVAEPAKPEPKKEPPKQVAQKPKPKPQEKKVVEKKPEPKKQVQEKPKQVAEVVKKPKPKPVVEPEPVEDFIDEDLIRGSYVRELIGKVRNFQTYPRKALLNREQGDGVVSVTIDRAGEVLDVSLVERTGSRELDKGIIKMIRKAAPFPGIPTELTENEFQFEVPVSFTL